MGGGFTNSAVGAGGSLTREQIKSPNYSPGSAGWIVRKDGSAEFNNGVFRGTIQVFNNGAVLIYNTPTPQLHSLVFSLSPAAGTDSAGNNYPAGFAMFDGTFGIQIFAVTEANGLSLFGNSGQQATLTQAGAQFSSGAPPAGTSQLSQVRALSGYPTGTTETLKLQSAINSNSVDAHLSSIVLALMQSAGLDGAQAQFVFDSTGGLSTLLQIAKALFTVNTQTRMNDHVTISESNTSGALTIFQNVGTSNNPGTISIQETAAGNGSLGLFVNGDSHARFVLRASGEIDLGDGTNPADLTIKRTAAGVWEILQSLKVDGVITATGGTVTNPTLITTDSWVQPALAAGWGNIAGDQQIQYRLTADHMVEIVGTMLTTSATPSATPFTLDANHSPATTQRLPAAVERLAGGDIMHAVDIGTGGVFTILNVPSVSGRGVYVYARFPKS